MKNRYSDNDFNNYCLVKDAEAAFILGPDGMRTLVPRQNDNDYVPEYVEFVIAIACLYSKDEEFQQFVWHRWNEILLEEIEESNETE